MAAMFTEYLHHDDRYELESVRYCDDALTVLQRQRFDLVLVLSLRVPWRRWPRLYSPARRIVSAFLFLKHMRALRNPPPVILVSGSPLAEVKKQALAHGAFAFIHKPSDLRELDRVVISALENRTGSQVEPGAERRQRMDVEPEASRLQRNHEQAPSAVDHEPSAVPEQGANRRSVRSPSQGPG
jgi:CheY-like chemotaxis protein